MVNSSTYGYQIEVNMYPNYADNKNEPYFWVLWSVDKVTGNKANATAGWASTPEKAWAQAFAAYNMRKGSSLAKVKGIKELWQIVYTLADGSHQVGDCFESIHHAYQHAAEVDYVKVNGELQPVSSFCANRVRYVPDTK